METYKLIIAYDGTDFRGFQRQAEDQRTVQGELERGLKNIGWTEASIKAAGRTDAGVHARGQVITCSLNWRSDVKDLTRALNANLPPDIAVSKIEKRPMISIHAMMPEAGSTLTCFSFRSTGTH